MISVDEIEKLEKNSAKLEVLHSELTALARKSPNDALNKFKLQFVNAILSDCNSQLEKQYKPLEGFELFDEDALPTNSDASFIIAQYMAAFENFRSDNVEWFVGTWYYKTEIPRSVKTRIPDKLRPKK